MDSAAVAELVARQQILDVLNRYARGVDRNDWALVRACYHADAHDDHGLYKGGVDGLIEFLAELAARFLGTSHQLGNHLAQIDGDRARAETSCLTWFRRIDRQGRPRSIAQGVRYLDRCERRDGRWAIADRIVVFDWEHAFEAVPAAGTGPGWQHGARGAADPSHGFFHAGLRVTSGTQ